MQSNPLHMSATSYTNYLPINQKMNNHLNEKLQRTRLSLLQLVFLRPGRLKYITASAGL